MSERPRPVILSGGDLVIPGDPDTLGVLVLALRSFRTSAPRIRAVHGDVLGAAQEAHIRAQQAAHRAAAATPGSAPVLPPAAPAAQSVQQVISADQAAALLGVRPRRVRQLAAAGTITARRAPRDVWEIDRRSAVEYAERRRERGHGVSTPHRLESQGNSGSGGPAAA